MTQPKWKPQDPGATPASLAPGEPIPTDGRWPAEKPEGYPGPWPPTKIGPFLGAALQYAARKWRVHPLKPRDKVPLLKDWPEKATPDPATIFEWWTRWPDANVGLVPGAHGAGLAVVDVDPRNGGIATLERLRDAFPDKRLPATQRVLTGSGGYHLYFDASAWYAAGRRLPGKLGPGIDVKANDTGNIVAPPSIHPSGRAYAWLDLVDALAPYPVAWLDEPTTKTTPKAVPAGTDDEAKARRALARLGRARADEYESWLQVGMALKSVSDDLLDDWDAWSRQSAKYRAGDCAQKWPTFAPKERGLTFASLVAWAREDEEVGGLIFANAVRVEPIDWLWFGRLAFGKLQGLVGMPDVGKDVIAGDIAARLSKGAPMPDGRPSTLGDPRPTYYLSVEDALGDTLKPRFLAAGGDDRFLVTRRLVTRDGAAEMLLIDEHLDVIRRDLDRVRQALRCGPGLVILSPFDAFLSAKVDAWKSADIRRALAPIVQLIEETGWALWAIAHLNKDPGKAALHRIANSQAFAAAFRVAYLVGADPNDPARRAFVPLKRNLLPPGVSGLALRHVAVPTPGIANPGPEQTVPRAEWLGATPLTAADLLAGPQKLSKEEAAGAWLLEQLEPGTRVEIDDAFKQRAVAAGHEWRTVRRAKEALGIQSERPRKADGTLGGTVWWTEV